MPEFIKQTNSTKSYLILSNILLVFFLILLSNLGMLPFKNPGDFIFFIVLILAFSLYRPSWSFLFFIGMLALENVNLAPREIGLTLRPYQFLGILIFLALGVRMIFKRLNFQLPKWKWFDLAIILFGLAGFLSLFGAVNLGASFKLSIIVFSFILLYFLTRAYIQNLDDLKKIIPFFLGSSIAIVFYGIWQNIRFAGGLESFEVMPGRVSATFTEPDWLGMFLIILIVAIYAIVYQISNSPNCLISSPRVDERLRVEAGNKITNLKFSIPESLYLVSCILYLVLTYIALILTVSRSAWLGALAATFIFLFMTLTNLKFHPRNWQWFQFFRQSILLITVAIISVGVVYVFDLTSFQLFNRAQSSATGLQKITIACGNDIKLPEKVESSEELIQYNCRHINLEEIRLEEMQGNYIKEIYRPDPNVNIRKEIYRKSWEQIRQHPVLGIGWGGINDILGQDERGAGLNASNIFLEIWLGAGFLGLGSFLAVWIYILLKSVYAFFRTNDRLQKAFALFVVIAWMGLTVFNLFNAGIMLGFLWVFLACALLVL